MNRNCNQLSINIKFTMDLILKYFPDLTEEQKRQFAALYDLYLDWNSKINVISRKDIENLYEHHVLHSLGNSQGNQVQSGDTNYGPRAREEAFRESRLPSFSPKYNSIWWTASERKYA